MENLLKKGFAARRGLQKNLLPFGLSLLVGVVSLQIPFTHILGTGSNFTLFDFIAPTFAALWGMTIGLTSVLAVNLINFVLHGSFSIVPIIRLFPVLFAAWYFGRRSKASPIIGLVCMVLFIAHPIGRQAWYYSLYWLIPLFTTLLGRKNVFLSALGATFTQHAVGGVAFLYAFGFTAGYWKSLIPVVAAERLLLGVGITVSYVAIQAVARGFAAQSAKAGIKLSKKVFALVGEKS